MTFYSRSTRGEGRVFDVVGDVTVVEGLAGDFKEA